MARQPLDIFNHRKVFARLARLDADVQAAIFDAWNDALDNIDLTDEDDPRLEIEESPIGDDATDEDFDLDEVDEEAE